MSTRVPGLPTCWRVLPIIPPRGYTSYCRGTGTGLRPPLTPPDPQLRWPTQFYVIDPSLAPGYRPRPGGTPRMDTVHWAREVVRGLRGTSALLEEKFDRAADQAEASVHVPARSAHVENLPCV